MCFDPNFAVKNPDASCLRTLPEIVFKLYLHLNYSEVAVQLAFNLSICWWYSISWTGHQFRIAALYRTLLGYWNMISFDTLISLRELENNQWLKGWAKLWVLLFSVTSYCEVHQTYKALNPFSLLNWTSITRGAALRLKWAACHCQQQLLQTLKRPVFLLALLTSQECAGVLPQELNRLFWWFFWIYQSALFLNINLGYRV